MQGWHRRVGMDHMLDMGRPKHPVESGTANKWTDANEVRRAGVGHGPTQNFDEYALEGFQRIVKERLLDPDYDKARTDQPHLLKLSLTNPHYPYFADRDRFAHYLNRVDPFLTSNLSTTPGSAEPPTPSPATDGSTSGPTAASPTATSAAPPPPTTPTSSSSTPSTPPPWPPSSAPARTSTTG